MGKSVCYRSTDSARGPFRLSKHIAVGDQTDDQTDDQASLVTNNTSSVQN